MMSRLSTTGNILTFRDPLHAMAALGHQHVPSTGHAVSLTRDQMSPVVTESRSK
jgi:hypothetical protein